MRRAALLVLSLSVVALGRSAPDCEQALKPLTVSLNQVKGKYAFIGAASNLPGSRFLSHTVTGAWVQGFPTSQSDIFEFHQAQRLFAECYILKFNMTVEDGATIIRQPFYLRDDFLPTNCPDCVTLYEVAISGKDTFKSLILFSKSLTVPDAALDLLKTQAECLKLPSVIVFDTRYALCPEDAPTQDGIQAFNHFLEAKVMHIFARIMDAIFDLFVN